MSGRENKPGFALWLALAAGAAGAGFFLFELRPQLPADVVAVAPAPKPSLPPPRSDPPPTTPVGDVPIATNERMPGDVPLLPEPAPDPAAATRAIEAMPESPARNAQMLRALGEWSGRDPIRAGAWVATMPEESARAAAIVVHAEVLRVEGPRTAALWLSTLPAADQSLALIEEIGSDWLRINRTEAEAWLAQTSLPEERRERLRASIERNAESP